MNPIFHGVKNKAAQESYAWSLKNADKYRIAYCCHADDFPVPDGWTSLTREFSGMRRGGVRKGDRRIVSCFHHCAQNQNVDYLSRSLISLDK